MKSVITFLKQHNCLISHDEVSVSGLSAGGYMAVQLHVAYSSVFKGAGIFAAGPYFCSQGEKNIAESWCMQTDLGEPDTVSSIHETIFLSTRGLIDKTINLCDDKIFIQSGNKDFVVLQEVAKHLERYYKYFVKNTNIKAVYHLDSNHCIPVDKENNKLKACEEFGSPFIGMCSYDGAGEALKHIYETDHIKLNPQTKPNGQLTKFSQKEFWGKSQTMHESGYVYIPAQLDPKASIKLHVVLHGCLQSLDYINTDFVELSGYNEWAEANNMIILYPQVANVPEVNTAACWDWWGYEGDDFHNKNGAQIQAIMAMVNKIIYGPRED